jgi:glycerate-2-kinase
MGAWGCGPFENDDAADWCYLLVDGGAPEVVGNALRAAAAGPTVPNLSDAAKAVAAAAVVGAGLGLVEVELPDDIRDWLVEADSSAWPPLAPAAVTALDRVLTDSELLELWGEAEDDSWAAETRAIRDGIDATIR